MLNIISCITIITSIGWYYYYAKHWITLDIKNCTYYVWNDMMNTKNFDSSKIKTDKFIKKHSYLLR